MMRKLMIAMLLTAGIAAQAQNGGWSKPTETKQEKKYLFQKKKVDDSKYLAGAVPESDGRVMFTHTVSVPGKDDAQIYNLLIKTLQGMAKSEGQIKSEVAIVNETTSGPICMELMLRAVKIIDDTYPTFMHEVWA